MVMTALLQRILLVYLVMMQRASMTSHMTDLQVIGEHEREHAQTDHTRKH